MIFLWVVNVLHPIKSPKYVEYVGHVGTTTHGPVPNAAILDQYCILKANCIHLISPLYFEKKVRTNHKNVQHVQLLILLQFPNLINMGTPPTSKKNIRNPSCFLCNPCHTRCGGQSLFGSLWPVMPCEHALRRALWDQSIWHEKLYSCREDVIQSLILAFFDFCVHYVH